MTFTNEIKTRVEDIEEIIYKYLPEESGCQKTVMEAMNYSVKVGGKRLRPMLMQETYKLFGGNGDVVEPFMAAIEMIHTYSLVHDDLPAMDNDMYRRGKKTTHAVYGEAMGILAGDGLLNYAYEVASKAFDIELSENVVKAMQVICNKPGIYGMLGGQVIDVESENKQIDLDTLNLIHELKTAALIECSMLVGAILAGASKDEQDKIQQIAKKIGIAFQIQDDVLDVTSTFEVLGKPIGSDEKNNKTTYVGLRGIDNSREDVKRLTDEAVSLFDSLSDDDENKKNDFLRELLISLVNRDK